MILCEKRQLEPKPLGIFWMRSKADFAAVGQAIHHEKPVRAVRSEFLIRDHCARAPRVDALAPIREAGLARAFEVDPLRDRRWNNFVERHPRSSVFHRAEWLRALKWAYGYEPATISSCSPDSLLTNAIVFCRVRSPWTGNRLVSLPFSDHCEVLANSAREAGFLMSHLRSLVDGRNWTYAEVRPLSSSPWAEKWLAPDSSYFLHKLDLRPDEKELFAGLHHSCVRRKIHRAQREALRCDQGTSLLPQFYKLMQMTRRRHGLPPQPLKWFRSLADSFGDRLKIRIASKGDIPVAGILTLSHRKTMIYKYACSDARFQSLGGNALLLWKTICEAKAEGFEELDLGRSYMSDAGLVAFKERWGAARSMLTYQRYPVVAHKPAAAWTTRAMMRMASMAPNTVLTLAGDLLYRHMG
jgi:hypothetical protein